MHTTIFSLGQFRENQLSIGNDVINLNPFLIYEHVNSVVMIIISGVSSSAL
jgi:hypothetical protein